MRLNLYVEDRSLDGRRATQRGPLSRFHLDGPLLLALLLAAGLGLAVLYSSGRQSPDLMTRQAIRLGLGFLVMIAVAQVPPRHLQAWTPWAYLLGLGMLVAVLLIGDVGKGAQRWLDLGFVRFQPSEMMKIAVPMMVAWHLAHRPLPPGGWHVLSGALITLVPFALILQQPDLGTGLLVVSSGLFALFLAGLGWRIIIGAGALAAVGAPLFWSLVMRDYQRQRVLTLFDPESDPLGAGYHIIQSKIAIGSGGIYGKGWLNSSQANLEFLPESSTDFIFAVLAEEFGLIGVGLLLALYFFIIARSLYIAGRAHDTFGRLVGGSLGLIFFVYVFVNMGMVSGILPVVGLPLPMISYGGTSLVTIMAGFGILMSTYAHRPLLAH